MGLPPEVREMIYMHVFAGLKLQSCSTQVCYPKVLASSSDSDKKSLAILCVNKQINRESCALLLQRCDPYFLNRPFHVFRETHLHYVPRQRLGKAMYQEIRTIWITTEHLRSWDQHGGLKCLSNVRLINIDQGVIGGQLFRHLTCALKHRRDPRSFVSIQDRRSLVDLSVKRMLGPGGGADLRITPGLRPIVAKDKENPDQLRIHVHFRCPPDTCLSHRINQRVGLLPRFTFTKTLVCEYGPLQLSARLMLTLQ